MMRPGLTTETHFSGAPLPLPMRVSAGFLVKGLSGKIRIHNLPPRLMKRVMATREASIWRSVIQAFSMAFRPYSPNARSPPRQAFPLRRPRICFRYFTFLGINIVICSFPLSQILPRLTAGEINSPLQKPSRYGGHAFALFLNFRDALGDVFALVDPALHADYPVRRVGFGGAKIDVGAQRLQRQPALQVPFFAGDFCAVQAACYANLDALASETQRRIYRFAHRAAEGHALFELQRDRFRDQRGVEFRTVHFHDVDVHFAFGALLHVLLQLVDFRALAADDDAGARGVNAHHQLVGCAFDIDRADARALQLFFQLAPQLHVFVQQFGVVAVGIPARLPRLVVTESKSVRVRLLSHSVLFFAASNLCYFSLTSVR